MVIRLHCWKWTLQLTGSPLFLNPVGRENTGGGGGAKLQGGDSIIIEPRCPMRSFQWCIGPDGTSGEIHLYEGSGSTSSMSHMTELPASAVLGLQWFILDINVIFQNISDSNDPLELLKFLTHVPLWKPSILCYFHLPASPYYTRILSI